MPEFIKVTTTRTGGGTQESSVTPFGELFPTSSSMLLAADNQIKRIKERTRAGLDVNGAQFKEYSASYAKVRQKAGLSTSPPDLRFTGELLDSMQGRVLSQDSFAIEITSQVADRYCGKVNTVRRFFDTSQEELLQVVSDLRK